MNRMPAPVFDRFGRRCHLIGRRRCEHLAGTGRVEHAVSDEAGVQRLVARSAAGDQRYFPLRQRLAPDKHGIGGQNDQVGVRGRKACEALAQKVVNLVDEFFHCVLLPT